MGRKFWKLQGPSWSEHRHSAARGYAFAAFLCIDPKKGDCIGMQGRQSRTWPEQLVQGCGQVLWAAESVYFSRAVGE